MPAVPLDRAAVRMFENYCDEAILVGDLPGLWMPYWSPPEKRDLERMEKSRTALRSRALPFIERTIGDKDYLCGEFSLADVGYMCLAMVLQVDAFDAAGKPDHKRGVSTEPGVYFLGLPWLSRRGSSFIWGVWSDAGYVADHIAGQRMYVAYRS
jgi:hypothetical protein